RQGLPSFGTGWRFEMARRECDETGYHFQYGEPQTAHHGDDYGVTIRGEPQQRQPFPYPRLTYSDSGRGDQGDESNNIRRSVCGNVEYDSTVDSAGAEDRDGEQPEGLTVCAPREGCSCERPPHGARRNYWQADIPLGHLAGKPDRGRKPERSGQNSADRHDGDEGEHRSMWHEPRREQEYQREAGDEVEDVHDDRRPGGRDRRRPGFPGHDAKRRKRPQIPGNVLAEACREPYARGGPPG